MKEKKHYHRGRRKAAKGTGTPEEVRVQRARDLYDKRRNKSKKEKQKKGGVLTKIILFVAVIVFCFSAFQLYKILSGYYQGRKEYNNIKDKAVKEDGDKFTVDFDELLKINPDTVAWIRFNPQPEQINYPVVQARDNETYLTKTFANNENTVGAIFVNSYNNAEFNDRNTIVYGHRMNDSTMFHDLEKYKEESFWKKNPYFYIYTPDGRKITYHIYAAGVVKETSDVYRIAYDSDEDYQKYLDMTKQIGTYRTGIDLDTEDTVVTLSTCVKDKDDERLVVLGVKEKEE